MCDKEKYLPFQSKYAILGYSTQSFCDPNYSLMFVQLLYSSFPDIYFGTIAGPCFIYSAAAIQIIEELMEAFHERGRGAFIF